MNGPDGRAAAPAAARPELRRVLGLPSLFFFGLAYMVPLAAFTTYGIVTDVTRGHLPAAYLVTLAAMAFTALSYASMVRAYPVAGSAYTYTQQSFGPATGFLTGWALLLDYIFLPTISYIVIGLYLGIAIPAVPAWIWILLAIALVTGLNVLGIKLVTGMNMVLVGAQGVFIATFLVMSYLTVSGRSAAADLVAPFFSPEFSLTAVVAGSAVLCLSFLGFDAISTLSEEARNPRTSIPRAIVLCTVFCGLLFVVMSWAGHLVYPDWQTFTDPDSASVEVMARAGGDFLAAFFTAAYVAACFASAMAAQGAVSRILFSMGRDGALPERVFARVHPEYRTPHLATLVVGAISLLACVMSLDQAAALVSFGALIAFTFVNLSVIKHYAIDRGNRRGADLLRYVIAPGIGVALTIWLWTSLSPTTFAIGLAWVAIGFLQLLRLTRGFKRPAPTTTHEP
ncbi:Amino acid transporter [Saccharopolyspora antimicrobica]|uniref:Amino acid transporter n=1 Tax=Saccharopolyspora antimicrobica TaxID=455193 RepID=A0A1I5ACJ3_9PSEU|nr:amino acid permease [Saccharopolyspora antimicrobica]RKT83189.1 amino acid/polyamine/organocation transporter (APC superfamily) [Saccharopolyspora antimicrobica]SFN60167.1 Amino acid transporter [Saccharopolyspora antimicrobica]